MKNCKQLFRQCVEAYEQELSESGEFTAGGSLSAGALDNGSAITDFGSHRIQYPKAFQAAQAFLSNYSGKPVFDPQGLLATVKMKLNILGLDFKYKGELLTPGMHSFRLYYYSSPDTGIVGQNYGEDMNKTPFVRDDDGITSRVGHPMYLNVNMVDQGGKMVMTFDLSPNASNAAPLTPANPAAPLQGN